MPIYEYKILEGKDKGETIELYTPSPDKPHVHHPDDESVLLEKIQFPSRVSFQLKGGGWPGKEIKESTKGEKGSNS